MTWIVGFRTRVQFSPGPLLDSLRSLEVNSSLSAREIFEVSERISRETSSEQGESRSYTRAMSQWFVYIAKTKTGKFYTGITTNPTRRILEHNSGKGALMGIEHGPFSLVYISPPIANKSLARRREIKIKDWSQEKKLKLISGEWK